MRVLLFILALTLAPSQGGFAQDPWSVADRATVRLALDMFPDLPPPVHAALRERDCRIPQSHANPKPHNLIHGDLRGRGQADWAVLCSRGHVSTLLVFWDGDTVSVDSLATMPDRSFLQHLGLDAIGFSRALAVVDSNYIWRQHRHYGGTRPPTPTHAGIEDHFLGKGSTIWYWHEGRWLPLQGVD